MVNEATRDLPKLKLQHKSIGWTPYWIWNIYHPQDVTWLRIIRSASLGDSSKSVGIAYTADPKSSRRSEPNSIRRVSDVAVSRSGDQSLWAGAVESVGKAE
jgi:hypothetical protein